MSSVKTFDVELPEVESHLLEYQDAIHKSKGYPIFWSRTVVGIEIIKPEPKKQEDRIPDSIRLCGICDGMYDLNDPEQVKIHDHPEPQSGLPREQWLASHLPYKRWVKETPEGKAWHKSQVAF